MADDKKQQVETDSIRARMRSLELRRGNYKSMHRGTAQNKGKLAEFLAAETLTEMRKVLWGVKKKNVRKGK